MLITRDVLGPLFKDMVLESYVRKSKPPQFISLDPHPDLDEACYRYLINNPDYPELKQTIFAFMAKNKTKFIQSPEWRAMYPELSI